MRARLVHVRPHRRTLVVAAVLGLLGTAAGPAQPPPEATERQPAAVVAATRLERFVGSLADGLDTEIGVRGTTLSGGDASGSRSRALLRAPRLLLLDEASSQVDAVNESALRAAVAGAAAERTVVTIAPPAVHGVAADRILLVEGGRVQAQGTHLELVEVDELYRELAAGAHRVTDASQLKQSSAATGARNSLGC